MPSERSLAREPRHKVLAASNVPDTFDWWMCTRWASVAGSVLSAGRGKASQWRSGLGGNAAGCCPVQWLHSAVHSSGSNLDFDAWPFRPPSLPRCCRHYRGHARMKANAGHAGLTSTCCRPEPKEDWVRPVDPGRQDAHTRIGRRRVAAQPHLLAGPRLEHCAVQLLHADPAHLQRSGMFAHGKGERVGTVAAGWGALCRQTCAHRSSPCGDGQRALGKQARLGSVLGLVLHWRDSSKHA